MNQLAVYEHKTICLFDDNKEELIRNTICKGSTQEEFELFIHACKRTGLDPFMRQIYAVKRWDSSLKREAMTIQTGIDGYRLIAERSGKYSPGREPTFTYSEKGQLISATAFVKKQTADGTWHDVAATAFYEEYCQKNKDGKVTRFWQQMAHTMLAKCAEALALRKAFPGDLSGIYTREEMLQADVDVPANSVDSGIKLVEEPKNINKDQWIELNQLIQKCDEDFQKKLWDFLDEQNIKSFEEMEFVLYKKLIKRCNAHIKGKNETDKDQTEK